MRQAADNADRVKCTMAQWQIQKQTQLAKQQTCRTRLNGFV